jgi:hypothetical protein
MRRSDVAVSRPRLGSFAAGMIAGRRTRLPPERDGSGVGVHRALIPVLDEVAERAGHTLHTVFVDDLDARIERISARGIEPAAREAYGNGVRKVIYRDPDGNEVGFRRRPIPVTGGS